MAKFTSLLFVATAAIASFASAAPVAIPTVISTVANPSVSESKIGAFDTSVKHTGKATWFTDSYGACNFNWDGKKEPIVALNAHQMGEASWGNPVCGQRVRITNKDNKKAVVARIVDKCPGDECAGGSLDLSPAAFTQIGELDTGILNIEWNYI